MKVKVLAAVAIVCMLSMLWTGIPVRTANPVIKIGVIRPIGLTEGLSTEGGCKVAEWWINDGDGTPNPIVINGQPYDVQFIYEDEHAVPMPEPEKARAAALKLITVDGVDMIMGGTMDECWDEVQEECADREVLCLNTGCTLYSLQDCGYGTLYGDPTPCGHCIRCDYERYKYVFRTGPCNSTVLAVIVLSQIYWILMSRLVPIYGAPVKTAVMVEDLEWTAELYELLIGGAVLPPELVNIVYSAKTPYDCSNFMPQLDELKASGAHLLITFYYLETGATLVMQLDEYPGHIPVIVTGSIVQAQTQEFWEMTGGECEYVTAMTAAGGTRSPIVTVPAPITTQDFWDRFIAINGFSPTHNGFCAFDTVMMMKEVLEAAGIDPPLDPAKTEALIPYIELMDRQGIRAKLKWTGPNPGHNGDFSDYDPATAGNQPYPYSTVNPGKKGTLHDVWGNEMEDTWEEGYSRSWLIQWQAERMEIVHPPGMLFSRRLKLPVWMYPYITDLNFDGKIDIDDVVQSALAFGSYPGHPRWDPEAELTGDGKIDIDDVILVCIDFGKWIPLPLP